MWNVSGVKRLRILMHTCFWCKIMFVAKKCFGGKTIFFVSGVKVSFLVLKSTFLVFFFGCFFHPWVVKTLASPHRPPRLLEVLELPLFGFGLGTLLESKLSSQNGLKKGKSVSNAKPQKPLTCSFRPFFSYISSWGCLLHAQFNCIFLERKITMSFWLHSLPSKFYAPSTLACTPRGTRGSGRLWAARIWRRPSGDIQQRGFRGEIVVYVHTSKNTPQKKNWFL